MRVSKKLGPIILSIYLPFLWPRMLFISSLLLFFLFSLFFFLLLLIVEMECTKIKFHEFRFFMPWITHTHRLLYTTATDRLSFSVYLTFSHFPARVIPHSYPVCVVRMRTIYFYIAMYAFDVYTSQYFAYLVDKTVW